MGGRDGSRKRAWRGALAGVACGALAAALYQLYYEVTSPSLYNFFLMGHAPVFMTFGGMAGLLVWAMLDSESSGGGYQARTLEVSGKRRSDWRGLVIGASCGVLITLPFWLYLELTRPGAYARFIALTYGTVLTVFCGLAGFVFGATRDAD